MQGQHNPDTTGAEGEDMPEYASLFCDFFQFEQNCSAAAGGTRRGQLTSEAREARRVVEQSLVGAMAPLGESGQATLRTEVDRSHPRNSGFAASQEVGANLNQSIAPVSQTEWLHTVIDSLPGQQPRQSRRGRPLAPRQRVLSRQNVELNTATAAAEELSLLGGRAATVHHEFQALSSTLLNALSAPVVPARSFTDILSDMTNVQRLRDEAAQLHRQAEVDRHEASLRILDTEMSAYEAAQRYAQRHFNADALDDGKENDNEDEKE